MSSTISFDQNSFVTYGNPEPGTTAIATATSGPNRYAILCVVLDSVTLPTVTGIQSWNGGVLVPDISWQRLGYLDLPGYDEGMEMWGAPIVSTYPGYYNLSTFVTLSSIPSRVQLFMSSFYVTAGATVVPAVSALPVLNSATTGTPYALVTTAQANDQVVGFYCTQTTSPLLTPGTTFSSIGNNVDEVFEQVGGIIGNNATPLAGTVVDAVMGDSASNWIMAALTLNSTTVPSAPTIESFTSSGNLTCANVAAGVTLTWASVNGTTASVNGQAVATNGSITVYPTLSTVYTLTVTNANGSVMSQLTVTVDPTVIFPKLDGNVTWFNMGYNYPSGQYLITCCGGAFQFDGTVAPYSSFGVNWSDGNRSVDQAFKITTTPGGFNPIPGSAFTPISGQGRYIVDAPGHFVPYPTAAAASAANLGNAVIYNHFGGPIGVYLNLDSFTEVLPATPSPSFGLQGPGPAVVFSASSTAINAGQSSELAWSVANNPTAVTIDNGIGAVLAAGSQTVTPEVQGDIRYNLTATGAGGLSQTIYVDIWVCGPKPPANISFVGGAAGAVVISWSTVPVTACSATVLVERSTTINGIFAQIESGSLSVGTFIDTTPIPGTTYYYRIRTTDNQGNYSPYTVVYAASSIVAPSAPDLSLSGGVAPGNGDFQTGLIGATGLPFLSWSTVVEATSFNIYRGLSPGALTLLTSDVANAYFVDTTASYGVTYYYAVTAVNTGGESPQSSTLSITPSRWLGSGGASYN